MNNFGALKSRFLNMKKEKRLFLIFSIIFSVIWVIIHFLYTACMGIACDDSGRIAVGMEFLIASPDGNSGKLYFYNEEGNLVSSAEIPIDRRGSVTLYSNADHICYDIAGSKYYYDYNGTFLKHTYGSDTADDDAEKCRYNIKTDKISVRFKKILGFEHVTVQNENKIHKHIYFKAFLDKFISAVIVIPFLIGFIKYAVKQE